MDENSKRKAASQANGKLGGSKTESGRYRSSQNALKHGLYARRPPVLTTEQQAHYDTLAEALQNHHQPQGAEEIDLVSQLIDVKWLYYRHAGVGTLMIEGAMAGLHEPLAQAFPEGISDDLRQSVAIADVIQRKERTYLDLHRILHQLRRAQRHLLRDLKDLQGPRFNAGAAVQPHQPHEEQQEPKIDENEPTSPVESTLPAGRISNWQPLFQPILGLKLPEFFGPSEYQPNILRKAA